MSDGVILDGSTDQLVEAFISFGRAYAGLSAPTRFLIERAIMDKAVTQTFGTGAQEFLAQELIIPIEFAQSRGRLQAAMLLTLVARALTTRKDPA